MYAIAESEPARMLDKLTCETLPRDIVSLSSNASGTPLFCFQPIEGSLGSYRQMIRHLDSSVAPYGCSEPNDDTPCDTLDTMVNRFAAAITTVTRDRPCRLFGYSFGGFLAMNVAHRLEQLGQVIERVSIVDWVPFPAEDMSSKVQCMTDYFTMLHQSLSQRLSMFVRRTDQQARATMQKLVQYVVGAENNVSFQQVFDYYIETGLAVKGVSESLMRPLLNPLVQRLPLCRGTGISPIGSNLEIWEADQGLAGGRCDWSSWTTGMCQQYSVPGDHLSVMRPPHVQRIAAKLSVA